jgi:hypothetical protein
VNPGPHELFVYYRVQRAHWRDAVEAVERFQQRLRQSHAGLVARVLRRPQPSDEMITLMETYALDGGGVDLVLEAEIERNASALRPWLIGDRHCERFEVLR